MIEAELSQDFAPLSYIRKPNISLRCDWADNFSLIYEHNSRTRRDRRRRDKAYRRARGHLPTQISLNIKDVSGTDTVAGLMVERAYSRNACIRTRLQHGFHWIGGFFGGEAARSGYVRQGFRSKVLVSSEHPILKLWVTKLPRSGMPAKAAKASNEQTVQSKAGTERPRARLRSGMLKSILEHGDSKILMLDDAHVDWSHGMQGIIRVDIDSVFAGWEDLREQVSATGAPMPNLAVGHEGAQGQIERPHFYWLLNDSVCVTKKSRKRPTRLLKAVEIGLVQMLLPIGADPGGLANSSRGKNAVSPMWSRKVLAEEPYQLSARHAKASQHLVALAEVP